VVKQPAEAFNGDHPDVWVRVQHKLEHLAYKDVVLKLVRGLALAD